MINYQQKSIFYINAILRIFNYLFDYILKVKDSLESIIAVWKSISPSAANLQVVPTFTPKDEKPEDNKSKSNAKSKSKVPSSHTDLLMSLMQSQQPSPFASSSSSGFNDSNRDRKVKTIFMIENFATLSNIFHITVYINRY